MKNIDPNATFKPYTVVVALVEHAKKIKQIDLSNFFNAVFEL